ncbi:MAG: hypothetical protein ACRC6E_10485 [Fusobacteriaceae bacterium]
MSFENQLIGKDKYITVVTGNRKYLIEDFTDLNSCFVFATKDTIASLKDLISSDYYKFESYENNRYIVFADGFPIDDFKVFKVLKPETIISTPFSFNNISSITPNALNSNFKAFENLCVVMQKLMNERVFKVDTTVADTMLPRLKGNEVWKRSEDDTKFEAFNVGDIEANLSKFWEDFYKLTVEKLAEIESEGNKQTDRVADTGDEQVDRINASTSSIDNRLESIWRMYSILTGSQRYLSGNVLTQRNVIGIEKTVDGGKLSERVGEPKRLYTGNSIEDRALPRLNVLDLGEMIQ